MLYSDPNHHQPVSGLYDLYLTVTSNHLIVMELSIVLMVVSSTCDISKQELIFILQRFLPFSMPMTQPYC